MYEVIQWNGYFWSPIDEFHGMEVPPGRSLLLHAQIRDRSRYLRHGNQWKVVRKHR